MARRMGLPVATLCAVLVALASGCGSSSSHPAGIGADRMSVARAALSALLLADWSRMGKLAVSGSSHDVVMESAWETHSVVARDKLRVVGPVRVKGSVMEAPLRGVITSTRSIRRSAFWIDFGLVPSGGTWSIATIEYHGHTQTAPRTP